MVRPEGVEPPTYWFVASCSIQLSYGRTLLWMQLSKDIGNCGLDQPSAVRGRVLISISSTMTSFLIGSRPKE